MLERSLHGANIANAIATVAATAADLTVTGGIGTAIGAALSGTSIYAGLNKADQAAAKVVARVVENSHLPDDRRRVALQLLAKHHPSNAQIAQGNVDPTRIAARLAAHIEKTETDPALITDRALRDYQDLLIEILNETVDPSALVGDLAVETLRRSEIILARLEQTGDSDRLRNEGITEKAIIRLAQRIAREVEDVGQAWLELQNAMDIAVRVQQDGKTGSNHDGFVDEVLRRVADLAADGEYDRAHAETDEALERLDAEKDRVLQQGIEVALVAGDTARAARLLVSNADMDAGGVAEFEALRALQDAYYVEGRDKGLKQPLLVSIDLGHILSERAQTADQRGAALVDTAVSFRTLGEREVVTDRLKQAVTTYESALGEFTRDRVPMEWARTQMNMATALRVLGERESGTERLEQAVRAHQAALEEWTRDRGPLEWAAMQMNMANALRVLGERESGTERLEQAVRAYKAALEEYTQDQVPLQWAITQYNLAVLEIAFFEKTKDPARLDQARVYGLAALEVFEEAGASQYIGMTQNILAEIDSLAE